MAPLVVIEDNPGDLRLIHEAVRQVDASINIVSFDDGPQALHALCGDHATLQPGAILLDLRLKTSDGIDVLRQLRFAPRLADVLIFVFTSSEASVDKQRSLLLGAARFIPKPLKVTDYFRVLTEVVQGMLPPEKTRPLS